MSRPYHQILEIIALLPEVIIDAEDWNLEELKEIAAVAEVSKTKITFKNAKKLSYEDLVKILSIKGSYAENKNVVLEL
ncbi:MAG: hypothetical protein ACR2NW_03970 [Thermodesulfobacteriota bacterium]